MRLQASEAFRPCRCLGRGGCCCCVALRLAQLHPPLRSPPLPPAQQSSQQSHHRVEPRCLSRPFSAQKPVRVCSFFAPWGRLSIPRHGLHMAVLRPLFSGTWTTTCWSLFRAACLPTCPCWKTCAFRQVDTRGRATLARRQRGCGCGCWPHCWRSCTMLGGLLTRPFFHLEHCHDRGLTHNAIASMNTDALDDVADVTL